MFNLKKWFIFFDIDNNVLNFIVLVSVLYNAHTHRHTLTVAKFPLEVGPVKTGIGM